MKNLLLTAILLATASTFAASSGYLRLSGTVAERVYVQNKQIITNSPTLKIKKKKNVIIVESTR